MLLLKQKFKTKIALILTAYPSVNSQMHIIPATWDQQISNYLFTRGNVVLALQLTVQQLSLSDPPSHL